MANKNHLKLLLSGVQGWNEWKRRNPRMKPLLAGAELEGADLKGANLSESDLRNANLASSYLSNANLQDANMSKANLQSAYNKTKRMGSVHLRKFLSLPTAQDLPPGAR